MWSLTFTAEQVILDLAFVSLLLVLATMLRRRVGFLQRYFVPNCLVAGVIGFSLGPGILDLLPISTERMGVYVYHLLALTFIAVGLRGRATTSRAALHNGFIQILVFAVQTVIGLAIVSLVVLLIQPTLAPALGMLLTLGFGMGPGVAYAVGQSWEALGVEGAGSVGLTLSTAGFLVAYGTGIALVNRGIRRGEVGIEGQSSEAVRTGFVEDSTPEPAGMLTTSSAAIDALSLHVAVVGVVYLITFGLVSLAADGLVRAGLEREVPTLWSFHFIAANLLALLARRSIDRFASDRLIDAGLLNRLTGLCADYLIAASIMAINVTVIAAYALPISLLVLVGTPLTYLVVKWASRRSFTDHLFERFIGLYGEMTGTLTSGLALVRVTDPEYETPVAQDLALGSGVALTLGFPLLILINLPLTVFAGSWTGYAVVAGVLIVYAAGLLLAWRRFGFRWG
ncbi:MAG: hypothetical protein AAF752_14600 [Bacteroidota bacterium]